MDIIELILSNYTDFTKFEDLANEIMIQEGYNNLIPVGGWHDEGVDARLVKYFEQKEHNVIFQYSLQKETKSKISQTYSKIKGKGKRCDELIIVTLEKINNKEEVKKNFRKEYGVKPRIEIYDRQTFKSRLGTNSSLLNRFFPNIKKQLESDLFNKTICADNRNSDYEKTLLKMTIAFSQDRLFIDSNKKLFDSMVQYFVYLKNMCTITELKEEICKKLSADIHESRILASIERLLSTKKIKSDGGRYFLDKSEVLRIEELSIYLDTGKEALLEDILYKVQNALKRVISPASIQIAKRNIEESITDYFRLYSLERSISDDEIVMNELEFSKSIISKLKQGLPDEEADILVYAVGELLKKPTEDQKATLQVWCQTYIGLQVLKLDPKQIKIQSQQLKDKKFVLDTDFALNLIVSEVNKNSIYKRIITKLIEYESKIIIPDEVLNEVAKHAEFANRSYYYFQNKFDILDQIVIDQQVKNVFAKGFFSARENGSISDSTNFDDYIRNYYNKNNPIGYLKSLVRTSISNKIEFVGLGDTELLPDGYEQFENLQEKIYELTIKTFKAEFRNDEENREIARIDARLYLNYLHKNKNEKNPESGGFKFEYYVLTTSTRPLKCAKELNILAEFYIKPLKMIAFMEKIEPFELSYEEVSNIFSNPFLAYSVSENWKYVEKLIDIGVNLKDSNITRLKWELAEVFEGDLLTDLVEDETDKEMYKTDVENSEVDEFMEMLKEIDSRGYKFIPAIKMLIDKYKEEREKNLINTDTINELEEQIEKIGKRKRKYLRRVASKFEKR